MPKLFNKQQPTIVFFKGLIEGHQWVFANIALEKAGHKRGEHDKISPNDQINMSQSTNDTYPTALKLIMLMHNDELKEQLNCWLNRSENWGKSTLKS